MFIPSKLHHSSSLSTNCFIPEYFGIVCWNVHKNNDENSFYKTYLETVAKQYHFLFLQEANFRDDTPFMLSDFMFDAAANLEFRGMFYGVLSASKIVSKSAQAYLSEGKETLIGPHKSLLVTKYIFEDGSPLIVLNVHAINFRKHQVYTKELERFLELMYPYKGAMIVTGDFNTWNKKRMYTLHRLREKLKLKMVPFDQKDAVKSFMGNQLDFIFYRGVELLEYHVDKRQTFSDHNPLFAQFKKVSV